MVKDCMLSPKIKNKIRISLLATSSYSQDNSEKKKKKERKFGKKEVKLSLFTDDMILYTENPKEFNFKTTGINKWVHEG